MPWSPQGSEEGRESAPFSAVLMRPAYPVMVALLFFEEVSGNLP